MIGTTTKDAENIIEISQKIKKLEGYHSPGDQSWYRMSLSVLYLNFFVIFC